MIGLSFKTGTDDLRESPLVLSDPGIFEALARHVRENQIVLDLVKIPQRGALRGQVTGLCW